MSKERVYMLITLVAAYLQGVVVPSLHLSDAWSFIVTSLLLMIAAVFTIKKQRVSIEVNSKAKTYTWILIALAVLGGINEILASNYFPEAIHFEEKTTTMLRNGVAGLFGLMNVFSKVLFPTDEAKIIDQQKETLKAMQNFKS